MQFNTKALGTSLGASQKPYKKGIVLVRPGTTPTTSYIIVEGVIKQYDIRENGTVMTLNLYKPGSILALPWILNNTPADSFFECASDCILMPVATNLLHDAFRTNHELTLATLSRISRGMEGLLHRLSAHSSNDAAYRIITELSIEAARFGIHQEHGTFVSITPSELALRTGLSRETVSRHISHLVTSSQLTRTPGGYIVHNP